MVEGLAAHFSADHRHCDALWAEVEAAVEAGEPAAVAAAWERFDRAIHRHLTMEEEVLFPAFEAATGMTAGGPTHVMRFEHLQMRKILAQMAKAAERQDHGELLDQGETLLLLIQQHNVKEENMLYPLSERALGRHWPELQQRLARYASED